MTTSASFCTTVTATGNNTGIEVPDEVIELLGAGRRPAVTVNVNGFEYQSTVGVMGGRHLISISAAIRKQAGLHGGDAIQVELTLAERPREVAIPADLAAALAAEPAAAAFFATLSNSVQRYHVDSINAAKADATRQRRLDKAMALFRQERQR